MTKLNKSTVPLHVVTPVSGYRIQSILFRDRFEDSTTPKQFRFVVLRILSTRASPRSHQRPLHKDLISFVASRRQVLCMAGLARGGLTANDSMC